MEDALVSPRDKSVELSAVASAGVGRKSCQPDEHVALGNPSPVGQQLAQLALFRVVESTVDHLGLQQCLSLLQRLGFEAADRVEEGLLPLVGIIEDALVQRR